MAESRPQLVVIAGGAESEAPPGVDFGRVRAALVRAVSRVLPSWLAAQRDDVVQAAMMKVMAIARNEPQGDRLSGGYLWRVAHSATVDEIRRHRSKAETFTEAVEPEAKRIAGPDRELESKRIGGAILDCLAHLGDDRRRAVTLYLQGHGPTEIAALLGWSGKRAENLSLRGLADLRACLAAKGLTP